MPFGEASSRTPLRARSQSAANFWAHGELEDHFSRRRTVAHVTDDVQLIDATLTGDRAAFGHLVQKYQDRLYSAMVQVTVSRTDAEDVVQEAFVKAYTKLDSFQGSSGFYTWLYRIAFNIAISNRRRMRVHLSV